MAKVFIGKVEEIGQPAPARAGTRVDCDPELLAASGEQDVVMRSPAGRLDALGHHPAADQAIASQWHAAVAICDATSEWPWSSPPRVTERRCRPCARRAT